MLGSGAISRAYGKVHLKDCQTLGYQRIGDIIMALHQQDLGEGKVGSAGFPGLEHISAGRQVR
uniref:Uncharacterized protein n=1 Tax=Candidatus Kentrum sp. SD TaxID=2126332 RepID=A0A450YKW6_9GAMM|nr:MAG: hypothetical protein BECKSD772F_GA0070984_11167 [Candidatus Kentron sp. SD]VFK48045.1 MAG: hypothetical protein BECKSD772E_GA0070983_11127 [Candidatus Kentron sp. SD]VFK80646.1 MAG: hypothetical protein BECKSD772D_GA0070982_11366 [Candidatus Kentron sp. SD]